MPSLVFLTFSSEKNATLTITAFFPQAKKKVKRGKWNIWYTHTLKLMIPCIFCWARLGRIYCFQTGLAKEEEEISQNTAPMILPTKLESIWMTSLDDAPPPLPPPPPPLPPPPPPPERPSDFTDFVKCVKINFLKVTKHGLFTHCKRYVWAGVCQTKQNKKINKSIHFLKIQN